MATNQKIPSFEFFKKYTHHEECVDMILKAKANSDQNLYELLATSKGSRERALRSYYEAFYFRPKIRESYHIRLKSVPKKIKDKLLSIPVQDTDLDQCRGEGQNNNVGYPMQDVISHHVQTGGSENNLVPKLPVGAMKRNSKIVKHICADNEIVEDDIAPATSPSKTTLITSTPTSAETSVTKNQTNLNNPKSLSPKIQKIQSPEKSHKETGQTKKSYKDLLPYAHCCPVTILEFQTYTNVSELFEGPCQKRFNSLENLPYFIQRAYILYYLDAENNRNSKPMYRLKILPECPEALRDKILEIPTNLYLKDEHRNDFIAPETDKSEEKQQHSEEILAKINSSVKEEANQELITSESSLFTNKENMINNNNPTSLPQENIQNLIPCDKAAPSLPVSLEEFQKFTHYLEVIDKLFKIKAEDNLELLNRYKSSQEAFDSTLTNYYQAFYLIPAIRNLLPIRYKPLPNFIKNRLLKLPKGVNEAVPEGFELKQLVTLEFEEETETDANVKVENPGTDMTTEANEVEKTETETNQKEINENSKLLLLANAAEEASVQNVEPTTAAKNCDPDNKGNTASGSNKISTANEDNIFKSPPSKRQKVQPTDDEHKENTRETKKSYRELLPYAHCCPVTIADFIKHTNVSELFKGVCLKRYNNLEKLPFFRQRAYILYYLNPHESRNSKPLNKLEISKECPDELRKKILEIPTNLYLKEEKQDELMQQEQDKTEELPAEKMDVTEEKGNEQKQDKTEEPSAEKMEITEEKEKQYKTVMPPEEKNKNTEVLEEKENKQKQHKTEEHPAQMNKNTEVTEERNKNLEVSEEKENKQKQNKTEEPSAQKNKNTKVPEEKENKQEQDKTEEPPAQKNTNTEATEEKKIKQENLTEDKVQPGTIEILENRLLAPTAPSNQDMKSPQCSDALCIFYHINQMEFMELFYANIKIIEPQPQDFSDIQSIFKKKIYNIIKDIIDITDKYLFHGTIMRKIMKHNQMCEKCEREIESSLHMETENVSNDGNANGIEMKSNESPNEADVQNSVQDVPPIVQTENTINNISNTQKPEQVESLKNSILKSGEDAQNSSNREKTSQNHPIDLWKSLNKNKIFQKFRLKLLAKLNEPFDDEIDFSETYNIFIQCNEIPLKKLLNDFCDNHEDITTRILNDIEICEALRQYYYYKYLTNTKFAVKYPVKPKENSENQSEKSVKTQMGIESNVQNNKENEKDKETDQNKTNAISPKTSKIAEEKYKTPTKSGNDKVNGLEKAKRIFFRQAEKTHTLSYIVRTSFGLKQNILRTILGLTFDEFLQNTNIYEGKQLYDDKHIAECMYRYVFRSPLIWPTNLYISLQNLFELLRTKEIHISDYSTILHHISPKLLHWSVLLSCTNILECVQNDYDKRTGKLLDMQDIGKLKQECIEYYDRCWRQEKWLGGKLLVNEEFYKDFSNAHGEGDVTMLDECALQEITKEPENNETPAGDMDTVSTNNESNTSPNNSNRSIKEFNCVILPSTQQQIQMLPEEANDPLNNSTVQVNVSYNADESYEIISLGELSYKKEIKTEPISGKLLTNLQFYEDENSDMQCTPCTEVVVDLDASKLDDAESLPPSQMDFEEPAPEFILSDNLPSSNTSNSLLNLAQRLPSSVESNETQQFFQPMQKNDVITSETQLKPLPDVSLRSSGETEQYTETQQQEQNSTEQTPESELLTSIIESLEDYVKFPEAQRFPSSFEDTQTFSGSSGLALPNYATFQQLTLKDAGYLNNGLREMQYYPNLVALDDSVAQHNSNVFVTQDNQHFVVAAAQYPNLVVAPDNSNFVVAPHNASIMVAQSNQSSNIDPNFVNAKPNQNVVAQCNQIPQHNPNFLVTQQNLNVLAHNINVAEDNSRNAKHNSNTEVLQHNPNLFVASEIPVVAQHNSNFNVPQQKQNVAQHFSNPAVSQHYHNFVITQNNPNVAQNNQSTILAQQDLNVAQTNSNAIAPQPNSNLIVPQQSLYVAQTNSNVIAPQQTSNVTLRRGNGRANATVKNSKPVAKTKNSEAVPQITHNTRPLATIPAYSATSSNSNNNTENGTDTPGTNLLPQSTISTGLTPAEIMANHSVLTGQNSSYQLLVSPSGTHIFISQELNSNSSIFNNTSLLRLVDNFQQQKNVSNVAPPIITPNPIEETLKQNPESKAVKSQAEGNKANTREIKQQPRRRSSTSEKTAPKHSPTKATTDDPTPDSPRRLSCRSSFNKITTKNKNVSVSKRKS